MRTYTNEGITRAEGPIFPGSTVSILRALALRSHGRDVCRLRSSQCLLLTHLLISHQGIYRSPNPEEDPEEDDEEDPEEDPADYPADRGDDRDDEEPLTMMIRIAEDEDHFKLLPTQPVCLLS
ncbi:hypothetical protein Tco_0698163 [Tanacetum coccineum]